MASQNIRVALLVLVLLASCSRSRVIKVNVINSSSDKISNIIVDYPSATFGVRLLAPGKTFQYAIKVTEDGALKIEFTDAQGKIRKFPGPAVRKDDEGNIEIKLTQDTAVTYPELQHK